MNIHIKLRVQDNVVKEDQMEIEDHKIEELSEDELMEAIEILIRDWAEKQIQVEWEVEK